MYNADDLTNVHRVAETDLADPKYVPGWCTMDQTLTDTSGDTEVIKSPVNITKKSIFTPQIGD